MTTVNNDLKRLVLAIVDTLEYPCDCDEEGTPVGELGWNWDEAREAYVDEDGDCCETFPLGGFDYLKDALDIEYIVDGKGEYRGARVLVAFGGPDIWVNTRTYTVEGAWWANRYSASFSDAVGLDEACRELWSTRA